MQRVCQQSPLLHYKNLVSIAYIRLVRYDVALRYVTFVVISHFGILINVLNVGAMDVHRENTFSASSVATPLCPARRINEKEKYENMCVRNADF